jgi:hypothetical protein
MTSQRAAVTIRRPNGKKRPTRMPMLNCLCSP